VSFPPPGFHKLPIVGQYGARIRLASQDAQQSSQGMIVVHQIVQVIWVVHHVE